METLASPRYRAARTIIALVLLAGTAVTLGACNTTAGVGQDVSATGHAVTSTADKAKDAM